MAKRLSAARKKQFIEKQQKFGALLFGTIKKTPKAKRAKLIRGLKQRGIVK